MHDSMKTSSTYYVLLHAAGFRLRVARIVFVGFQHAARGSTEPFLWPLGLLLQTGSALDLVDVRLVTSDEAVLNSWLQLFRANTSIVVWTVSISAAASALFGKLSV